MYKVIDDITTRFLEIKIGCNKLDKQRQNKNKL